MILVVIGVWPEFSRPDAPRFEHAMFVLALRRFAALRLESQPPTGRSRGNSQRTGNIDNQQGPKAELLWAHKASEHFISSPVPGEKRCSSVMGALNTDVSCDALAPGADERSCGRKARRSFRIHGLRPPSRTAFVFLRRHASDRRRHSLLSSSGYRMPVWRYPVPAPDAS